MGKVVQEERPVKKKIARKKLQNTGAVERTKAKSHMFGTKKDGQSRPKDKSSKTAGKWLKWTGISLGAVAVVCLLVYLGGAYYFSGHFLANIKVNGFNVSGKNAAFVQTRMKSLVAGYELTVKEKDGSSDIIKGSDIDISYKSDDSLGKLIKAQNIWKWPVSLLKKYEHNVDVGVDYDQNKLSDKIASLKAVTVEQTEPVSAYPKFDGSQFVVEPEVYGTAVDSEKLSAAVTKAINGFLPTVDLLKEGVYKQPRFVKDSPEVKAAADKMNQYIKASITYTMAQNEVVDKTLISQWLSVDADMNVTFDKDKVKEWLAAFGDKYDTQGATRSITSPWGKTVDVSGGTYGWSIDEDTEYNNLVANIENGDVVSKEPAYYAGGTAASHSAQDWGSTYVEVDISAQHMWYIVNGNVQMETDVVTGRPGMDTPTGVYSILETQSPSILVGEIQAATGQPEYRTRVDYWMRVTWSGIGFHDANWQSAFGGSRYVNGFGSHGCINMPPGQAGTLFSSLTVGTPVIIHT